MYLHSYVLGTCYVLPINFELGYILGHLNVDNLLNWSNYMGYIMLKNFSPCEYHTIREIFTIIYNNMNRCIL